MPCHVPYQRRMTSATRERKETKEKEDVDEVDFEKR
jgi:hypothetical protein